MQETMNKKNVIEIITLHDLATIRKEIDIYKNNIISLNDIFEEQIKEFKNENIQRVKPIEEKIQVLEDEFKEKMEKIISCIQFTDDKFLTALKIKGDSYKEGRYKIIRHKRTTRKLNQSAFKKKYPKEFIANAEIGLSKADNAIGKHKVNELCNIEESYKYEFSMPE